MILSKFTSWVRTLAPQMYKGGWWRWNREEVTQRRSWISKKQNRVFRCFSWQTVLTEVVWERRDTGRKLYRVRELQAAIAGWRKSRRKKKEGIKMSVLFQMSLQTMTPDPHHMTTYSPSHPVLMSACVSVWVVEEDGRISWRCRSERCRVLLWAKWLMRGWERPASRHLPDEKQRERKRVSKPASECRSWVQIPESSRAVDPEWNASASPHPEKI